MHLAGLACCMAARGVSRRTLSSGLLLGSSDTWIAPGCLGWPWPLGPSNGEASQQAMQCDRGTCLNICWGQLVLARAWGFRGCPLMFSRFHRAFSDIRELAC